MAAVEAFCPGVEIVRPGVCAFATRGPSATSAATDALAERVAVERSSRSCRVGVADGPLRGGAGGAPRTRSSRRGRAPRSSRRCRRTSLERPELTDLLRRLGVRTLGDLAALPVATVVARFGPEGLRAHRLASGLDERPLAARVPPPDLQVSTELDPPAERVDVAAFAAKALADELHAGLAGAAWPARACASRPRPSTASTWPALWRHDGALTAAMLAERVRWQLDGWLARRPARSRPASRSCAWRPTRSMPTTAASSASGAATAPRPSAPAGPSSACRACSAPRRW